MRTLLDDVWRYGPGAAWYNLKFRVAKHLLDAKRMTAVRKNER